ncbi:MAG: phage baseplate assembly protein V, partial [Deltaproteobacteria bacterium]|nr:phage baseplate assembly protein V [Deltaproteobacteria bacterium]
KEGERLLNIRREELISESVTHEGLSELPGLFPGGIITLEGKGRKLITALSLKAKISSPYSELEDSEEDAPGLSARIKFRDLDTPFRPKYIKGKSERKLRAPTSPLTGWIHGEGNGESPEMDGMGRYKVLFPLDISGRRGGKTSSWIRKAAPYVGLGYGEHLPLCPGVEVLVDFMENDPSKPFIVGAVPNGETGNFIHQGSPRAGITSKGGGALIFDNTEAKQAVTLGTGSKRGFVGLTAGSPTKALVECDTDYLLCLLQNNIVGFSEMEQVGWHWGLCSSSGFMSRAFAAFAAFKGLAASLTSAAIRETKDEKGDDEDEPKLPYANDKTLISRYFSLAYFLLGQFMVCVDIISQTQGIVEESPLSYPHLNLLSLCASEDETTADYYAKLPEKNYLLKVLLCLLTMIGIGDMASTLTANEADLDGFKQNADAKHLTEDQKKHTLTAKKISFAQSAIASIIGVISTVMTTIETILEMVQGPAKGLLIENSDSYLSILAETGLALSARTGPTVLESSEHRVAQMLNKFVYEDLIPSHLVKPDLIDATGKGFQGGSAVVLRSTLVKALADEIVLAASMHLIEKCEIGPIALYCGKGSPTTDTPGTKLDLELNESISNISKEGLIQENTSSAEAKNILVQSTSESYPIQLETKKAPSAILLKQEKGELTKVRSLNLSQNNLKLASVKDTFLTLTTTGGASATLALNDKEKLSLTASKASLLTSNGSLEITQDSNTFKHPTKITLAVGKVTMDMESAKVTVANPPRVQVQAPLSSLGG